MSKWSTNKQKALEALLTSPTIRRAAIEAGISERAMYSYLSDPVFKDRLEAVRHEVTQGVIHQLRSNLTSAIDTIVHLQNFSEDERVRLSAAKELVAHGMNVAIVSSLTDRLDFWERETGIIDVQDD